jgi:hypothetical protein
MLQDWPEVSSRLTPGVLLCGNGLSVNIWPPFDYRSLFGQARKSDFAREDLKLFSDTENFERVLSDLNTAIRVNDALGIPTERAYGRYRSIQRALGHAVRGVHVPRTEVPDRALAKIREELTRYAWIFSISYDLILYWAMGCGGSFQPFVDHFHGRPKLIFDPDAADVFSGQTPVYFPHGALHLVVGGDGETWKLKSAALRTLLEQFGEPIEGDPQARPLLVTEGTARDKLRAIDGNAYLAHALARLRGIDLPVVVFGASLREQDDHLLDALNEHPDRAIAVSMVRGSRVQLRTRQREIYARLQTNDLSFFDASTHPLGNPELTVRANAGPVGGNA